MQGIFFFLNELHMQGVVLHHRATLCLQRGTTTIKREVVSLARPLLRLAPHTHTWDKTFEPIPMLKSCCFDTMKNNSCIISGASTVRTNYSNRAVLQHTSNGGAHNCEPEQPVQAIYPLLPLYTIAMYVEKDAYYSFRENAWTMEANPCSFVYKEKAERANAPIPSEHPPVRRKIVKTFRWDQRLQIQK